MMRMTWVRLKRRCVFVLYESAIAGEAVASETLG